MTNFELIDNYLTNRLTESDRKAFEQQIKTDPDLKADVEFQSSIVEGLKKARAAELKAMLNRVPVSTTPLIQSPLKITASLVGTAVIISAIYLYFNQDNQVEQVNPTTPVENSIEQREPAKEDLDVPKEVITEEQATQIINKPDEKRDLSKKPTDRLTPSKSTTKPTIEVVDPSEDLKESTPTREMIEPSKPGLATPALEVDVDSANKKYSFHYQFVNDRVILFGSFDKSLFEILEIHGNSDSTFLFYKENYFLLDGTQHEITPLEVIKDKMLIKKLKEYRNK
jgi:hypothetical protein